LYSDKPFFFSDVFEVKMDLFLGTSVEDEVEAELDCDAGWDAEDVGGVRSWSSNESALIAILRTKQLYDGAYDF
jgi:hypothetical protein